MGHLLSRRLMIVAVFLSWVGAGRLARADDAPRTVDLLPLIDVSRDAVHGTWTLDQGAVVSDDSDSARLRIPYEPPAEYDLHVEFVRNSGNNDVNLMFRNLGHSCVWLIGAKNSTTCGFTTIDGMTVGNKNNPSRFEGHAILQNGRKCDAVIQVRNGSVVALLDGKVISKCSMDSSKFSIPGTWSVGADGLGIGSYKSPTAFSVIEVVEISGPGKQSPRAGGEKTRVSEKKQDQAAQSNSNMGQDERPISGPTTRVSNPVATIKSLEVATEDSGMMLGLTDEVVLTVTRGETSRLTNVRFATPVGPEMGMARDDALRFIRLTYPNWYVDKAELTFEEKYVGHEGGSNGTAVATLILSTIQGFSIDQDAAITGDISANGKVRAIGGVFAKIHGATASKCALVAIPNENYDQLVDAMTYNGPSIVTNIQVMGISTLDDAVAIMRTDRDPKLVKAMALFAEIQESIKKSPSYLQTHGTEAQDKLQEILKLAPRHLSAQLLLMVAQGKQPRILSAEASEYYTFVAVYAVTPILAERSHFDTAQVPSAAVKQGLDDLKKLRPLADESVRPLIDAYSRFIWAWSQFQANKTKSTAQTLLTDAQGVDDAMAKLSADQDLMQKMLKQGI